MSMDLTIQQLRVVVAVNDAGSFTAAAARLHLAQSSLSRTVLDVERRLGVRLFERTTRNLVPSAEGEEFVRVARQVISSFDAGMNHFAGFLSGNRGQVRVATLPSLAATLLPRVVSRYRKRHPDVGVVIEDALSGRVLDRVRHGEVDLAVTVVLDPLTDLEVRPIAADRFFGIFPAGHRFREAPGLSWADLHGEPFIAFDATSSVRWHVDKALTESGARPGSVIEARNVAAVGGLVAAGLGVSVVPGLVLPLVQFADLRHRAVTDPAVDRSIAVVRDPRRRVAPAVHAFLDTIQAARATDAELPAGARWLTHAS